MELFSVIIPTFKGEDSLPIALESIARQTYENIEVIVSDDNGIGDIHQLNTEKIVDSFKDRLNITYLANEHVNGSHARNEGLKVAKGEYISLLDDDDFYMSEYVRRAIDVFHEKDVDMVFFDVAILTKEGISRIVSSDDMSAVDLLFYKKEIGTGSNLCFKRKIYDEDGGFDERYLRSQDIEFAAKKLHKYRSYWQHDLEIVKYYNKTDNFPDYKKSLATYDLLREDMLSKGIIDKEIEERLRLDQLHSLYNDLLAKNAPKNDIKVICEKLKEASLLSFVDKGMMTVYGISKGLFNVVFKSYMSMKNRSDDSDAFKELLEYRKSLEK